MEDTVKRLVIIGGGESGVGVALLAKKHGYDVFLSDSGTLRDKYRALLATSAITFEEGGHSMERLLAADVVVKSPGIPDTVGAVQAIINKGIPILSEIEFCAPFLREQSNGRTICITGSNGKTTTTSLIYHIMQQAGRDVALCGNIGRSLAMQLVEGQREWYVVELSSFQLDNCYSFRADIAVLLNITPDHLDRYDHCLQHYVDAKMRLLQNQTAADKFIYWAEDEHISRELSRRRTGETIPPTTPSSRVAAAGQPQLLPFCDRDFTSLHLATSLLGIHNQRNVVAAFLATTAAGVEETVVRAAIRSFRGVEHRLEYVCTKEGIDYINDSKATNVDACRVALLAMTKPTVLIVGGTDKGNDYSSLLPLIAERCRAVVFLGADNTRLHTAFVSLSLPTADTHSMQDCVAACRRVAQTGDAVLLSPCCASFDLFRNMEDRGEQYKECVHKL